MGLTHGGNLFEVARPQGWDWRDVLDFSANINPLGPAPGVKQAICAAAERIAHYPEREPSRLRGALAAEWNLDDQQVLLGNGATELIYFLARLFAGREVTLAVPVFSEFHRAFPKAGTVSLLEPAMWPRQGLLVLTRPANPLGGTLSLDVLRRHLDPAGQPVLIDESFLEFSGQPSAATLLKEHPQLTILRSLTKFYALPGLRIGALIGSLKTIGRMRTHREPWQVNVLAEEAALVAIEDRDHGARCMGVVRTERSWLLQQLAAISGVHPRAGDANFIYIPLDYPASSLCSFLLRRKILIRNCTGWPGVPEEAVRIAVRTHSENERLIQAWKEYTCG